MARRTRGARNAPSADRRARSPPPRDRADAMQAFASAPRAGKQATSQSRGGRADQPVLDLPEIRRDPRRERQETRHLRPLGSHDQATRDLVGIVLETEGRVHARPSPGKQEPVSAIRRALVPRLVRSHGPQPAHVVPIRTVPSAASALRRRVSWPEAAVTRRDDQGRNLVGGPCRRGAWPLDVDPSCSRCNNGSERLGRKMACRRAARRRTRLPRLCARMRTTRQRPRTYLRQIDSRSTRMPSQSSSARSMGTAGTAKPLPTCVTRRYGSTTADSSFPRLVLRCPRPRSAWLMNTRARVACVSSALSALTRLS